MGNLRIRDFDSLFTPIEHSSYHFTYNLNALWTTVMGSKTLVDLVAGIFTGATDALKTVKSGLEAAWDGIKNTGEYILDSVLDAMFSGFTQIGKLFLSTWLYITAALSLKPVTVDLGSDGVTARFPDVSSKNFLVKYQDRKMLLNESTFDFMDPLSGQETLSVDSFNLSAILTVVLTAISVIFASAISSMVLFDTFGRFATAIIAITAMVTFMYWFNLQLLDMTNKETSDLFGEIISGFFFALFLGTLLSLADNGMKFSKRSLLIFGANTVYDIGRLSISKLIDPFVTTSWDEIRMVIIWSAISNIIALVLTTLMEVVIGQGGFEKTLTLLSLLLLTVSFSYVPVFHWLEVN